jgi:hypothetical protein
MKAAWAVGAAVLVSVPILALPTRWSGGSEPGVTRYVVGGGNGHGSQLIIACPADRGAKLSVAVDGMMAPPDSDIGFRAANQTIVMHSDPAGRLDTKERYNAAAFDQLWQAVRLGDELEISFTNGASAKLPLTDTVRDMPETPCPVDYRAKGLALTL